MDVGVVEAEVFLCLIFAGSLIHDFYSNVVQQVLVCTVHLNVQKLLFGCDFEIVFGKHLKTVSSERQIVSCVVLRVVALLACEVVLPTDIFNLAEVIADPHCAAEGCSDIGFQPDCLLASQFMT